MGQISRALVGIASLAVGVAAVSGCPSSRKADPPDPPGEKAQDTTPAAAPGCGAVLVGAEGGEVVGEGIVVTIPSGALDEEQIVSVCVAEASDTELAAWTIESDGTFALAAAVTIAVDDPGGADAALFVPDPDDAPVRAFAATTDADGTIRAPLYRAGRIAAASDDRIVVPYPLGPIGADLLFVVDDSCSMQPHQETLGIAFADALPTLVDSGVDFRAGVVTTDMDHPDRQGRLREVSGLSWVDRDTPDAAGIFEEMAAVGSAGSGMESGLGAAYTALETLRTTANAGFQRPEATLSIVVVSDEDDQTRPNVISVNGFIDWLADFRPTPSALHAIVNPPPGNLLNQAGETYIEVADASGGWGADLQSGDWSAVFDRLVALDPGGVLPDPAEAESVEAWWVPEGIEQQQIEATFDAEENRVAIADPAIDPAEVVIAYREARTTAP